MEKSINEVVEIDGKYYLCDFCHIPSVVWPNEFEFMAFRCNRKGEVTDWSGLYTIQSNTFSESEFRGYVNDFKAYMSEYQNH